MVDARCRLVVGFLWLALAVCFVLCLQAMASGVWPYMLINTLRVFHSFMSAMQ